MFKFCFSTSFLALDSFAPSAQTTADVAVAFRHQQALRTARSIFVIQPSRPQAPPHPRFAAGTRARAPSPRSLALLVSTRTLSAQIDGGTAVGARRKIAAAARSAARHSAPRERVAHGEWPRVSGRLRRRRRRRQRRRRRRRALALPETTPRAYLRYRSSSLSSSSWSSRSGPDRTSAALPPPPPLPPPSLTCAAPLPPPSGDERQCKRAQARARARGQRVAPRARPLAFDYDDVFVCCLRRALRFFGGRERRACAFALWCRWSPTVAERADE